MFDGDREHRVTLAQFDHAWRQLSGRELSRAALITQPADLDEVQIAHLVAQSLHGRVGFRPQPVRGQCLHDFRLQYSHFSRYSEISSSTVAGRLAVPDTRV